MLTDSTLFATTQENTKLTNGTLLKRPSHGKLKLANSCWQTHVGVCVNGAKTVGKHVLFVANSLLTCLSTVFAPFTHNNLSLPTRVCQH